MSCGVEGPLRRDLLARAAQSFAGDVRDRVEAVLVDRLVELDQDVPAVAAIGGVEVHDGVACGARSRKKVEN